MSELNSYCPAKVAALSVSVTGVFGEVLFVQSSVLSVEPEQLACDTECYGSIPEPRAVKVFGHVVSLGCRDICPRIDTI